MNSNSEQKRIAFGYNRNSKNEIVIHPGQAAAVKLIFDYYLEGCSMAKIKDNLEGMRIPSPLNGENGVNRHWQIFCQIRTILATNFILQ